MTQQPNLDPFGAPYVASPQSLPSPPAARPRQSSPAAPPRPTRGGVEAPQAPSPATPPKGDDTVNPSTKGGETEEKPTKKRGTGLAYDGKPVMVSDEEDRSDKNLSFPGQVDDYAPTDEEVSFEDLSDINRQINRARVALFRGTQILAQTKRDEADKEFLYKRAFNRALLRVSGGTEKTRVTTASLQTEDEWGEYLVAQRVAEEATNHVRAIRSELDALAGLSHNVRAQMNVM